MSPDVGRSAPHGNRVATCRRRRRSARTVACWPRARPMAICGCGTRRRTSCWRPARERPRPRSPRSRSTVPASWSAPASSMAASRCSTSRIGAELVERRLPLEMPDTLGHDFRVGGLAFSPDGRFIAAANVNPSALVGLWSLSTGRLEGSFSPSTSSWVNQSVVIAQVPGPDGLQKPQATYLVIGTSNGTVLTLREGAPGRFDAVQTAQPHQSARARAGNARRRLRKRRRGWRRRDRERPATPRGDARHMDGDRRSGRWRSRRIGGRWRWAPVTGPCCCWTHRLSGRARSMRSRSPRRPRRPRTVAVSTPGGTLLVTRAAGALHTWRPGPPRVAVANIPLPRRCVTKTTAIACCGAPTIDGSRSMASPAMSCGARTARRSATTGCPSAR